MTRDGHIARAAYVFDRLLDHVGTAMNPGREDPVKIDALARRMDEELAAARAARGTQVAETAETGEAVGLDEGTGG